MSAKIKITKRENPKKYKRRVKLQTKTRWLFLLAISVPVIAFWVLFNSSIFHFNGTNKGLWLHPPLSIENIGLESETNKPIDFELYRGRWMLMYLNDTECAVSCLDSMNKIQQVRMALGRDRTRVSALIVTPTPKEENPVFKLLHEEFITLRYATIGEQNLDRLVAKLPLESRPKGEGKIYLIDPKSNIVVSYSILVKTKRLVKDIETLLKT